MKRPFIIILFVFFTINLLATDIIVNNTNDSGAGSLRAAITQANSSSIGLDNIIFEINSSDTNYDAVSGVWTILLSSELPMIMSASITIDGNSQQTMYGNTNPNGPEIEIQSDTGLEYCFRIVAPNNNIKYLSINGFEFAIQIYGTMANSINISDNYLGTTTDGLNAAPNDYGIGVSGDAYNISIYNNLISGNSLAGIIYSGAHSSNIYGNLIGTDIDGASQIANPTGIMLDDVYDIIIGGNATSERNIISGNTDSGVMIYGIESENNQIIGNYIGTDISGTDSIPNGNGIAIISSANNTIGGSEESYRNIISGNDAAGIVINGTGANENLIIGNYIGTDITGNLALSNHYGVIIKADADKNTVGGDSPNERNIISANWEIGVYIEASDSNIVAGNYIGTNSLGTDAFYINGDSLIQANGVEINTLSKHNIIGGETEGERNIISENRVYGGIYYGQVSENNICGNYIGTDVTGSYSIPNATGICVDDASNNNIIEQNLLSGNISYGLFIVTTGSDSNIFRGNLVGTNADATDSIPNDVGLLIAAGAKHNIIGGSSIDDLNIFSGNRYGGIELSDNGTDYNIIKGNFIGTDYSGNDSISNGFGIGVSSLVTGTEINNNVISGNKTFGIVLTENSDSTTIISNKIGCGLDENIDLGNVGCGILIGQGAKNNIIGTVESPNIIAFNDSAGIVIIDATSIRNRISGNSFYENEYLGIDIFPEGVNANDLGDTDVGPNQSMNYPVITNNWFETDSWSSFYDGTLDTENPENCTIEIYAVEPYGFLTNGQGKTYITSAFPNETGYWIAECTDGLGGEKLTAIAIDEYGNTSEFSENIDHITDAGDDNLLERGYFAYPNPTNGKFHLQVPTKKELKINLLDFTGRTIKNLYSNTTESTILTFNISDLSLQNGLYFIVIEDQLAKTKTLKLHIIL